MNESNYRNNRFNNKRNNAHKYNMGTLFTKFMRFFNFSLRKNKPKEPAKRVQAISNILKRRRRLTYRPKGKTTPGAIKQFAQMKRDHGHLWNGSNNKIVASVL